MIRRTRRVAGLASVLLPLFAAAQPAEPVTGAGTRDGFRPGTPLACPDAIAPFVRQAPDRAQAPLYLHAETFDGREGDFAVAAGNVELERADQFAASERIEYDLERQRVVIPGPVRYRDAQVWLAAERGNYDVDDEVGLFSVVDYGLVGASAHGSAEELELTAGRSFGRGIDFTTCPGDEPVWVIEAEEIELQHDRGQGVARHARLRFGAIPVLYAPWFSFPIDDRRKSGFLYPSFGNASDTGFELSVPWYWNIAPNQDATIEPRWFTDRGVMLTGQHRLLTRRAFSQLDFDYMYDDDLTGDERWRLQYDHMMALDRRWRSGISVDRVSDEDYFQDFGSNLFQTSRQYLHSFAEIDGGGRYWTFRAMADDWQVIDDAVGIEDEPYTRLPRLEFTLDQPLGRSDLLFDVDAELVYFDRDFGVEGGRGDVTAAVAWDFARPWGYVRPSAGYRLTAYDLDNGAPGSDDTPDRALGIYSLDAGLFFDRFTDGGNLQTLEPRLYYLYVPYEDQDALPDFDTGALTFSFSSLFHSNQFAGADRQSNANQVAIGLTTRTFDGNYGRERWSLSAGQAVLFDEPRVRLDDEDLIVDDLSPFLVEGAWSPHRQLLTRAGLQWGWDRNELQVANIGADWLAENGVHLGLEYRYRRDRVDQVDARALWPINPSWRAFGQVKYAIDDADLLETQAGVEYESCCWGIRLVYRRFLRNRQGDFRNTVYLELHLKGLASFGRRANPLFPELRN